jgi:hypothetical protein
MIRYRLVCNKSHEFEAWFGSSAAYDRQAKKGQVECPTCGSKKVTKAMMAPQVATRKGRRSSAEIEERAAAAEVAVAEQPAPPPSPEMVQRAEAQRQLLAMMRQLREEVASKAEYVGPKFAEEARKIHHKETEARGIWGEATLAEARELHEDGIECLPLPRLPEDSN